MSNTRNRCVGVGNAAKSAFGLNEDFAQLTQSYQAHGGEVNTGMTPQVQYSYADGSSNTIRITGMTYPNGRNAVDDYGAAGSMNDAASRIFGMKDSGASSNLVEYSYLGLSGFVRTVYPESSAQYTLIGTTGGTNPDSGDIYLGLDRFGRVIDANWANVAGTATLARVKYGYNRLSSRTWRDNLSPGMTGYDELYGYDQLQRLQTLGRGTLNGTQTAITSPTFGQDWTLDETGNWNGFKQSDNGSTWPLDQTRTANTVNEITSLVNETSKAWTTPAYDKAGNMTRIPVPSTLPDGVAWNTMSLSDWDNLKLADWEEMTLDNVQGVYDAWNRLVRLHVGDTTLAEYAYDARGYRIRKDSYADGTLTEARHYYYTPNWQVVEERVGTSTSADRQFVWGLRYIDDLVLRDRDTTGNGILDERRYCLQDGNWNTIALTNPLGIVTERFSYDAYGVPTFLADTGTGLASSSTGWEVLYAGYRWDGDPSRMYYVRNRFLLPYLGAWNRRDPIGYLEGAALCEYCDNAPLTCGDPAGLQPYSSAGPFSAQFGQGTAADRQGARDQIRLDYLHCISKWLISISDFWSKNPCPGCLAEKFPELQLPSNSSWRPRGWDWDKRNYPSYGRNFPTDYKGIREAMIRGWESWSYTDAFHVDVGSPIENLWQKEPANARNIPFLPGMTIERTFFHGASEVGVISTITHEAAHSLGAPGTIFGFGGHDKNLEHRGGMESGTIEGQVSDLFSWSQGYQKKGDVDDNLLNRIKDLCKKQKLPSTVPKRCCK